MDKSPTPFKIIFNDLNLHGQKVSPRGLVIKEIENYAYLLGPYVRFCNFKARKLNLNYIKHEFLWYLGADKYDTSILDHASMWKSLINVDGSINSNYGQYWFNDEYSSKDHTSQFDYVINTLIGDKDSRRASMMILQPKHLLSDTKDYPCTYAINFRIRNNQLNMSVHMRSQDAVFGMGNDIPCFSFIHEMLYVVLKDTYPDLIMGVYHHATDSFHVYERHFEMIEQIVNSTSDEYIPVNCPRISSSDEVKRLLTLKNNPVNQRDRKHYPFINWLTTFKKETI